MASRIPLRVLILAAVLFMLVVGPPIYLDLVAPEADAIVTLKYEGYRLNRDPDGGARRVLYVFTRYRTASGAVHTSRLMLGNTDYDRLSVGSQLRVRYLPFYPYTTRPVSRTTLVQARELLTPETTRGRWLALLLLFAPLTLLVGRLARFASIVVAAAWLGATWVYVLRAMPLPTPGPEHGRARVSWTQVQHRGFSRSRSSRLAVPYRYVGLTLLPPGARDSITVLDAVDSSSVVPAPANGSLVSVGYVPGAPRTARMLVGARTFINANRYEFYVLGLVPIGLALFGVLVLHQRRMRKATRAMADPPSPTSPFTISRA